MRLRRLLYARGVFSSVRLPVPVVSVGNLTFGGTGKTPTVAWLAREIAKRNRKPGILSRGYGGGPEGNDEGRMLAQALPGVPHEQNPDRVTGGRALLERHGVDAIVLDDGFQHLRLQRDLDLLLVDATDPFGGGACLPGGRLREPLALARRADLAILTRADLVSDAQRESAWSALAAIRGDWPRIDLAFAPTAVLETKDGRRLSLASVRGRSVHLLSAIGNPGAFRRTAEAAGLSVQGEFRFRDHHRFQLQELRSAFHEAGGSPVLVTAKDWVKIQDIPGFAPWVLEIEPRLLRGEEFLQKRLDALFPPRASR